MKLFSFAAGQLAAAIAHNITTNEPTGISVEGAWNELLDALESDPAISNMLVDRCEVWTEESAAAEVRGKRSDGVFSLYICNAKWLRSPSYSALVAP